MSLRPLVKFAGGTTAKLGNGAAECEDRFSAGPRRFAVADGASEAAIHGVGAASSPTRSAGRPWR